MPSAEELDELYKQSWEYPETYTAETGGTTFELARVYARKLARSLRLSDFRGLKLLDYGAGRGAMLCALSELGADVSAVEPFGYQFLKQQGFQVWQSLEEIPIHEKFDGIITIDVVEHLPNPWEVMKKLHSQLNDFGWIFIATPNASGLSMRLTKREAKKKGHLVFFTPKTMKAILNHCGFGRYQRLRWIVRYSKNPEKMLLHTLLQIAGWDGALRYLAWKNEGINRS